MKIVRICAAFYLVSFVVAATGQDQDKVPRATAGAVSSLTEQLRQRHVDLTRPGLLRALRNPDSQVRYLAALQLAEEKDIDSVPAIAEALAVEKVPETSVNIGIALVQLGQEKGTVKLTADCQDSGLPSYLRARAIMYMLPLGSGICFKSALELLRSDPDSRSQVLSLLTRYRSSSKEERDEILDAIGKCLADESAAVRIQASLALRTLADPAAIPELEQAITAEQDNTVRSQMQASLKYLQTARSAD
jgi:HEAT repeat protein